MEAVDTSSSKGKGRGQKKMNARVDFTPMVDMIMLLVTFFMLCTTLLKPSTMEIAMPSDKENINDENRSQVAASKAITILIDEGRKIYYFKGKGTEDNLQKTEFGKDGIRAVLMQANAKAQKQVAEAKRVYQKNQSTNPSKDLKAREAYKKRIEDIRNSDITPSVIIKCADKANYKDLTDILDEMNICTIGKYVIDNYTPADSAKIANKFGNK